jgi:hypothetical protein
MPTTTTRLALAQPVGADAASEFRVAITANTAKLDVAVRYFQGTLANRATVMAAALPAGPLAGDTYYGTDTLLRYVYNGTVWQTVMLAGAWTSLTGANGWTPTGSYTPAARLVGDRIELCGELSKTGGTASPSLPVATLPAFAVIATSSVFVNPIGGYFSSGGAYGAAVFSVQTGSSGLCWVGPPATSAQAVQLDGMSYRLS